MTRVVAGLLWDRFGTGATFLAGALFAVSAGAIALRGSVDPGVPLPPADPARDLRRVALVRFAMLFIQRLLLDPYLA